MEKVAPQKTFSITLVFGLAIIVLVLCGGLLISEMHSRTYYVDVLNDEHEKLEALYNSKFTVSEIKNNIENYLATQNPNFLAQIKNYSDKLNSLQTKLITTKYVDIQQIKFSRELNKLLQIFLNDLDTNNFANAMQNYAAIKTVFDNFINYESTLTQKQKSNMLQKRSSSNIALVFTVIICLSFLFASFISILFLKKKNILERYKNIILEREKAKLREKSLKLETELRTKLEFALNQAGIGVWDLNLNTLLVERSPMYDKIWGYDTPQKEWTYEDSINSVYEFDREELEADFKHAIGSDRIWNYEFRIRRPDKEIRWVWVKSTYTQINGEPHMIGLIQDITPRKELEEQLHTNEERISMLVNSSSDYLIIMIDPNGYIKTWNKGAEHITGYRAAEVIGKHFSMFYTPQDKDSQFPAFELRTAKEKKHFEYEGWRVKKDGTRFWASVTVHPLYNKLGEHIGFGKITRDLTERVQFERALQEQNLALEKANLTKNKFLASMSHEFRTPLNAIVGFTGTLLKKLPGPLNPEQEKQLSIVKRSSLHLLALINDLLDLSRIESGKIDVKIEAVDLHAILNEITATLTPSAAEKGLYFLVDLPNENIKIKTDRRAFTQIMINLVGNAIKFTKTGGIKIEIHYTDSFKSRIQIDIIDTGIGIKKENQLKLFDVFQRIQEATEHVEGTGLGLYISQKLANLVSCKIEFESEYGKGSRFSVICTRVIETKRISSSNSEIVT